MDLREKIARAIYDKPTRFDGDPIGTHLHHSMMIEWSTEGVEDERRVVMQVCEDAADAALSALDGGEVEGLCERLDLWNSEIMASVALVRWDGTSRDWGELPLNLDAPGDAATTLRALTAERDELRERAEKAEAATVETFTPIATDAWMRLNKRAEAAEAREAKLREAGGKLRIAVAGFISPEHAAREWDSAIPALDQGEAGHE
ncbi:MAG: hypothetical protein ACQEUZ_06380 [Pseudomonadota bacterium]